jgi:hypothetical protein
MAGSCVKGVGRGLDTFFFGGTTPNEMGDSATNSAATIAPRMGRDAAPSGKRLGCAANSPRRRA